MGRHVFGAGLFEDRLDRVDLLLDEQKIPDFPVKRLIEGVPGQALAGLIEADDAPPAVEHDNRRVHRLHNHVGERIVDIAQRRNIHLEPVASRQRAF